jgi:hypothetical protein
MKLRIKPLMLALSVGLFPLTNFAQPQSWYVEAASYGTQRESEPPRYVRNLGQQGGPDWVDFGSDLRLRYEYRDDDLRRFQYNGLDTPLLQRLRVFAGLHVPDTGLQLVLELEDARSSGSTFPDDERDVNQREFIQAFVAWEQPGLLGEDTRGNPRPLSLRAGRMAFELLDRRLVARNEWRNTSNNFDGIRLGFGSQHNDWQLQVMRLFPIQRDTTATDAADWIRSFDAVTFHWRRWSYVATFEPHWFRLRQDPTAENNWQARDIKAPGLRIHGALQHYGVDYDISYMRQHGSDGGLRHQAEGATLEFGYSWLERPSRPRLSFFHGRASGDANPADAQQNRFDRFFGFARPWSANDYIVVENLLAYKLRLEFQPIPGVRVDTGYSSYRLHSATDRMANLLAGSAANRDPSGTSGRGIGKEVDVRLRFSPLKHVGVNIGYAHFRPDDFVQNRQLAALGKAMDDSDFCYVELTLSLF